MKSLVGFVISIFFAQVSSAVFLQVQDDATKMYAILSWDGTDSQAVKGMDFAPRGSASLTPSGALAPTGIKYIIHAATGAMGEGGKMAEPTLESIRLSVTNSIRLAEKVKAKSIAIPLLGGRIFLERLGVTQEALAYEIIKAAYLSKTAMKVVFVGFEDEEYAKIDSAFNKSKSESADANQKQLFWLKRIWIWATSWLINYDKKAAKFFEDAKVVHGSITDFNLHHAEAIVNAANMELTFGAGLSGHIAKKTQQAEAIDAINHKLIQSFQSRLK